MYNELPHVQPLVLLQLKYTKPLLGGHYQLPDNLALLGRLVSQQKFHCIYLLLKSLSLTDPTTVS